jgi:hypothetical protein
MGVYGLQGRRVPNMETSVQRFTIQYTTQGI